MSKNIVLCSDGTGNEGGSTPDSNVFKIYKAIDINNEDNSTDQVTFYDNGVGTSKISIMQALGGGMGWGFNQNVRDLYEFLGRNYAGGDDIYIFGFSRGAATVRAFAGMIEHCGLVVKNTGKPNEIPEQNFQDLIDEAMKAYKDGKIKKNKKDVVSARDYSKAHGFRNSNNVYSHDDFAPNGKLKIEFMGIWDTVSSLGVPQLGHFDLLVNLAFPHLFYDLEPESCVNNVYHAIAVDDERRTFWPLVWDETSYKNDINRKMEQVWFSGMHSNVGGGYNRQELATITLDWMMEKLLDHNETSKPRNGGLNLKEAARDEAKKDANPFGKLHDSRSGGGIFYRYQPRPIENLCKNRLNGPIKIHETVFQRMKYRTGDYTPLNIPAPGQFQMVRTRAKESGKDSTNERANPVDTKEYVAIRKKIDNLKVNRISLYWVFMTSVILLVVTSICKWTYPPFEKQLGMEPWRNIPNLNWWLGHIDVTKLNFGLWNDAPAWTSLEWYLKHFADISHYFLPDIFSGTIAYGVIENPLWLGGFVIFAVVMRTCRKSLRKKMERFQEDARIELLRLRELK
ncbi:MAG: DUF2235 domain-containing protein [Nitrospina sp.]|jgi:uncharacterized protein (DUF2235 family)|nr:DUF2235 domain-containing protein [Nitrospina sp.]